MSDAMTLMGAVRFVREFFGEVAAFLRNADDLFAERDFEVSVGKAAIGESSKSLRHPDKWLPYEAYRFYKSDKAPHVSVFVCVLLDCNETEDETPLPDCLATVGAFVHPPGESLQGELWWARHHRYVPNRKDDGAPNTVDPRRLWPDDEYKAEKIVTLGLPLKSITSGSEIDEKLVGPLMKELALDEGT